MGISPLYAYGQMDTLRNLDAVTVWGLPAPHQFFSSQILKDSTLKNLQSLSVADALRFFSGVQIKDYGGIGGLKTVDIQHMGTQHTGVFYDGIVLNDVQNGTVDLGKFSLENLANVALSFGQNGQLLKSAKAFAMGNVIELETQKPVFRNQDQQNWKIKLQSGSFGLWNASTLWQQKIGGHTSNSFQVEGMRLQGGFPFDVALNNLRDTSLRRKNAGLKSLRLENTFGGLWRTKEWKWQNYFYQSDRGLPGAIIENKLTTEGQTLNDQIFFTQFSIKDVLLPKIQYQVLGKFNTSRTRYIDRFWLNSLGVLDQKFHQHETYISGSLVYRLGANGKVSLANDVSYQKLAANVYQFANPKRFSTITALAAQWKWNTLALQANIIQQTMIDRTNQTNKWRATNKWTPSLALNWEPQTFDGFEMNIYYKENFRMPNFNELYYTIVGNSNLKPEYAKQWGIDFVFPKIQLKKHIFQAEIRAFSNQVANKIIAVPNSNLFRWTMLNLLYTQSKGIAPQVNYFYTFAQWKIQALLQYTYNESMQKDRNKSSFGQQIPYTPKHNASVSMQAQWKNWMINYAFIYTGERYRLPDAIRQNYLQPWYTHDIGLQRKFSTYQIPIMTGIQINNILNQAYEVISNFPMPGINFKLYLSAEI